VAYERVKPTYTNAFSDQTQKIHFQKLGLNDYNIKSVGRSHFSCATNSKRDWPIPILSEWYDIY